MYARTQNNRIAFDVVQAVCRARARNFRAAKIRQLTAHFLNWYAE